MQPYSFIFNSCTEWIMARSNRFPQNARSLAVLATLTWAYPVPYWGPIGPMNVRVVGWVPAVVVVCHRFLICQSPKKCWLSPHYCCTWSAWTTGSKPSNPSQPVDVQGCLNRDPKIQCLKTMCSPWTYLFYKWCLYVHMFDQYQHSQTPPTWAAS